jgi:hypothetical protein
MMVSSARDLPPPNVTPFLMSSQADFQTRETPANNAQLEREMNIVYTPTIPSRNLHMQDPENSNNLRQGNRPNTCDRDMQSEHILHSIIIDK